MSDLRDDAVAHRAWDLLQAGRVSRFHTLPGVVNQTIAEHSGRVALLVWLLTEGKCRAALLWAALTHDLPEAVTGDVPAPAKWASVTLGPALAELESRVVQAWGLNGIDLTEDERSTLDLADCLDGMFTCIQERRSGNQEVNLAYDKWLHHLVTRWPDESVAWVTLLNYLYAHPEHEWNPWRHL